MFTDRPLEIARAAVGLTLNHPLRIIHMAGPSPRGWSGQPSQSTPPNVVALGSRILATLVSVGPRTAAPKTETWEVTGLAWNKRLRFSAVARGGYVAIRNLRTSPALKALPADHRSALEAYLSQLNDVRPGVPQAYVVP